MHRAKSYLAFIFIILGFFSSKAQQFVANNGQWKEPFDYKITFKNAAVFVDEAGLRINLRDPLAFAHFHDEQGRHQLPEGPIQHHGIVVDFNASPKAFFKPQDELPTYHNYFLGKDKETWKTNVPLYERLVLSELYEGIDMVIKPGPANLKYDLILSPEADVSQIRFTYRGADELFLHNGRLVIKTAIGRVVEEEPIAWQQIDGKVIRVPIKFALDGNDVSFAIEEYDENHELVIDPNFIFSTYSGSTADNFGYTATYDLQGNTYGGGIAFGFGYPTVGAFQDSAKGGLFDASISKFSADGTSLIYSTYLGGSSNDQPHSMVVDTAGNLFVLGVTGSSDFPVTTTAFDTSFNGGPNASVGWAPFSNGVDLFIAKFSASGSNLSGSTYLGGTSTDGSNQQLQMNYGDAARGEIITDAAGNVYFATSTGSTDFPTAGTSVFQDSLAGGQEAVLGKLNSTLTNLDWCTFIGGIVHDAAYSIKLNSTESTAFVAGGTSSSDFPVSANAYQTQRGGSIEGWVASFNAQNGSYQASTYNGTPQNDQNFFIELDDDDDVYLFGQTEGNYPVTSGLWTINDGTQFIHKMNPNLQQSIQSILFGSGGGSLGSREVNISPTALMVDACKSVYISGWGGLTNFDGSTTGLPVTPDAIDTATDGSDFYFMVLDGSWQFLEYATFFGGDGANEHVDGGTSRFSPEGIIHQAVCAGCGGTSLFPAFPSNVVSTTNNSANCNMACLRVDFDLRGAKVDIDLVPDSACLPHLLTFADSSTNVDVMTWDFGDGSSFNGRNPIKTYDSAGTYTLTVVGIDTLCNTSDTNMLTLHVFESLAQAAFTASWDTCGLPMQVSLTNLSTNTSSYFWDFGDGTTSTLQTPNKVYGQVGTYTIKLAVKDDFCNNWDTTSIEVTFKSTGGPIEFEVEYDPCINATTVKLTPLASGYQLYNWDFGDGQSSTQQFPTHAYSQPGTYTISLQTIDTICGETRTETQQVTIVDYQKIEELLPNVFTPNSDGNNDVWRVVEGISASRFTDFKIEVYNRWGNLLYTTYDPDFEWEGKFEQTDLAEGVYFWLAWFTDICGNETEENGVVHIVK